MARVELRCLRKVFPGNVEAVKGVTLDIEDREFVVLVGPSGCGKSTTLRMIAGLEDITGGEIHIGGRRVNEVPPKDRDIAMVFQNYALYPHMTVYKNMAFGLMLRKYPKEEIRRRVHNAAEILGITELLDRKPKALSGGQRQRVAVGRAIVRDPKVFLFDEPLSNLDAKLRVQMRTEIAKLHTRLEATMVYVTHDQVEAMTMGDRIVVMLDGEIMQVAPPLELYNRPANRFVAGFIGSPPMNLIDGRLEPGEGTLHFHDASGALRLRIPGEHAKSLAAHAGKPVTCGIRPEHFHSRSDSQRDEGASMDAVVEVVEPMGAETFLYVNLGSSSITARVESDARPEVGKPYRLNVALEKLHFFDAQSGEALN
jgi:multiple sugar transport system ATP-binding protein